MSSTPFDHLSDDILGVILLHCDFENAVRFSSSTNRGMRERFQQTQKTSLQHVWREIFYRHGYTSIENEREEDYIDSCMKRRRLLFNLLQNKGKNRCFNVPNRYFHFCPFVPCDLDDVSLHSVMQDAPPVYYECDSFVLTSPGISSELVVLDPFDGSLSVFRDCIPHCVASEEAMMEQAMANAASAIVKQPRNSKYQDWKDEHIAGAVIDESVHRNHSKHEYPPPQSQTLLGLDDYFAFDIAPYFPGRRPVQLSEEFEMNYVGTDSKPILDGKRILGFMVGVGRSVRNIQEEDVVCTELTAWTRSSREKRYGNRMVCRFPWTFHLVDMDARHKRLFVSFKEGDGPFAMQGQNFNNKGRILVYPFIAWEGQKADDSISRSYFPDPLFHIQCMHPISSFAIDSTGESVLVASESGTLELWHVQMRSAKRLQALKLQSSLRKSIREFLIRRKVRVTDDGQTTPVYLSSASAAHAEDQNTLQAQQPSNNDDAETTRFTALQRQPDLAHFKAPIESFYLPKHLPVDECGFVTLQHSRGEGSSLLLWQANAEGNFEVASIINLGLSSRRTPRVSYDGSRLIVFGEDHIGAIILVYHIACNEFGPFDEEECEVSGGVYNLTSPPRVRYSNRIRHTALGGIDSFDSIHMTCNERMIIVNTRTGNLLGASPYSDGLLVIDLQEKS